ncbi:MGMT family protein [Curtobacterium sp. ISL-83]|uniref:MGMT family protein n=1 Tax=Curtobacterium sp. ISL-83 TaxID=2819145 RepID=UPI001BE82163|nr:MGMT family protein [Curtobacterium sp. ISL-83]MBT2502134.1 MGMT family protein [Curtobacterium sp. ISL-83]
MDDLTEQVLGIVASIPAGRVMTYGGLAREVDTGARTVGRILHGGGHDIPWWRVVNADGRPYSGAADRARIKFLNESTPLLSDDPDVRVDLAQARWAPAETTASTEPVQPQQDH